MWSSAWHVSPCGRSCPDSFYRLINSIEFFDSTHARCQGMAWDGDNRLGSMWPALKLVPESGHSFANAKPYEQPTAAGGAVKADRSGWRGTPCTARAARPLLFCSCASSPRFLPSRSERPQRRYQAPANNQDRITFRQYAHQAGPHGSNNPCHG